MNWEQIEVGVQGEFQTPFSSLMYSISNCGWIYKRTLEQHYYADEGILLSFNLEDDSLPSLISKALTQDVAL